MSCLLTFLSPSLCLHSTYGKLIQNVRNRREIKLVTDGDQYEKLVAKPTYQSTVHFSDNFAAVELIKTKTVLDQPLFVGFAILELARLHMQQFHYGYIIPKYGNRAELLYTDTDSFIYRFQTEDVYADFQENAELFDFADYPSDHPNFSTVNKKVVGKMKDECNGRLVREFIGLRAKQYSLLLEDGSNYKRAKGIAKPVVAEQIHHQDYMESMTAGTIFTHSMQSIRPQLHQLNTLEISKTSLSPYDDKRYLLGDYGETSLPYGHYSLPN